MLTYLGSGFVRSGWNTGHGSFQWNKSVFADPEGMIEKLDAMHFKVSLHVWGVPQTLHGSVGDRRGLDQADHCAAYWARHRELGRLVDAEQVARRMVEIFFHGDRDEIVDFELGKRLFRAAPEPKAFETIHGAGHNDTIQVGGRPYFERIRRFLDEVTPP